MAKPNPFCKLLKVSVNKFDIPPNVATKPLGGVPNDFTAFLTADVAEPKSFLLIFALMVMKRFSARYGHTRREW